MSEWRDDLDGIIGAPALWKAALVCGVPALVAAAVALSWVAAAYL